MSGLVPWNLHPIHCFPRGFVIFFYFWLFKYIYRHTSEIVRIWFQTTTRKQCCLVSGRRKKGDKILNFHVLNNS